MNAQDLGGIKKREQLRSIIESKMLVDVMSKEFEYVRPEEQLSDVIEKMGQLDLHEISVSPDGKKLIGVVSYGTLLKRRNVSITTKAESVMVMPQLIGPESSVTTVAEAFLSSGYRQIPIVKGGSIQGTVTRADLIKIILDIKELKKREGTGHYDRRRADR